MTLFPESLTDVLADSILGRAQERGYLTIEAHQIRDYTASKQNQVDDYPYGGGRGAIMQADPLYRCWEAVCDKAGGPVHTVYLSPCGHTFKQADAIRFSKMENLILVCGHYEGIDERVIDAFADEELSIGAYILTSDLLTNVWTRKFLWEILSSPAGRSPPWLSPMRWPGWYPECWRTRNASRTRAIIPACWSILSTAVRRCGTAGKSLPFCFPAIIRKWPNGDGSSPCGGPGSVGRICTKNWTSAASRTESS